MGAHLLKAVLGAKETLAAAGRHHSLVHRPLWRRVQVAIGGRACAAIVSPAPASTAAVLTFDYTYRIMLPPALCSRSLFRASWIRLLTWSSGEHSGEDESAELNSSKADASRTRSVTCEHWSKSLLRGGHFHFHPCRFTQFAFTLSDQTTTSSSFAHLPAKTTHKHSA
eukprot:793200-Amphidinium_carterae.1